MDFLIQYETERSSNLFDLVLSKIQLLGFCRTVFACGNSIHNLALRSSERSVQSINILGGGNLIDRTLQIADREDRLIQALVACNGAEHFARFGYGNCAFLCHIGAYHFNNGNAAFFLGVLLHYIKIDRLGVQYIAVRGLHLNQRIALAVFQSLRCDKVAVCGGVESINRCHFGVSESHRYKAAAWVINLEACPCIRDCLSRFCIFLDNLDIALKVCVVDKVAVSLTVLIDKYIERLHQLSTLPTRGLLHGINAVWHILTLGKAVFIAGEHITLSFLCRFIAACGFQINLKNSPFFGCFNLCFAVVSVFDNGNVTLNDLFIHGVFRAVQLYGIKLWLCTDLMNSGVEQITLGRADFSDSPVIVTNIILGRKLTVCIGGISVNEFFALVNAIHRTCKGSVALRLACFCIGLCDRHIEFFENVVETAVCDLVPFNRCGLGSRNDIADCGIDFF